MQHTAKLLQTAVCSVSLVADADSVTEFVEVAVVRPDGSVCVPDQDGTFSPHDADHLPKHVAAMAAASCGESRCIMREGDRTTYTLGINGLRIRPVAVVDGTVTVRLKCQEDDHEEYTAVLMVNATEEIQEGSSREYHLASGDELIVRSGVPAKVVDIVMPDRPPILCGSPRDVVSADMAKRVVRERLGQFVGDNLRAVKDRVDRDTVLKWVKRCQEYAGDLTVLAATQPVEVVEAAMRDETWPKAC